ncbi:hypothetical protein [Devosia sp.]|uniref:hypothetical protein n=1 Tax=Devosia sp. TaxID=1871048 RepID=UPI003F72D320
MADDFEDLIGDEPANQSEGQDRFLTLAKELEKRCKAAGIECEVREAGTDEDGLQTRDVARFWLPAGRDRRKIYTSRSEFLEQILNTTFEKITLLDRYDGILDKQGQRIEARVRPLAPMATQSLIRRLHSSLDADAAITSSVNDRVSWPTEHGLTVSLGPCTDVFLVFADGQASRNLTFTITIEGVETHRHDEAVYLLERVFNAAVFSLDLNFNTPFQLTRRRPDVRPRARGRAPQSVAIEFPKHEYDAAPMSLYWYAGSARGMPLLQYLAYYQVLEFYFPTYSTREAGRKLQALLKDPSFRPDRDADITRMLTAISAPKGGGYGSEREQLRAAINECVEPSMLTAFFDEEPSRKEFFGSPQKGLTTRRVNLQSGHTDSRAEVADLIYDIRCRIVHTKGAEVHGEKLLLPFSREAELLEQNIDLIQFLARKVLIAASTPFRHSGPRSPPE